MDSDPVLAATGDAPYTAVIFTSVRRPAASSPEYAEAARRMVELAREQPGYLGIESATSGGLGHKGSPGDLHCECADRSSR